MPKLANALRDWKSDGFAASLKSDLQQLGCAGLPLHLGVSQGGMVDDQDLQLTVFGCHDDDRQIHAHVGAFFTEIVICCGCGDDPMPINGYCELQVSIDKHSGEASFAIHAD
jgi:hypothetical protein